MLLCYIWSYSQRRVFSAFSFIFFIFEFEPFTSGTGLPRYVKKLIKLKKKLKERIPNTFLLIMNVDMTSTNFKNMKENGGSNLWICRKDAFNMVKTVFTLLCNRYLILLTQNLKRIFHFVAIQNQNSVKES